MIQIQGKPIVVKVDTGAEVSVISDSTWKSLSIAKPLEETKISLYGSDKTHLEKLTSPYPTMRNAAHKMFTSSKI